MNEQSKGEKIKETLIAKLGYDGYEEFKRLRSSKGGKSVAKENRAFAKDTGLASRASRISHGEEL